MDLHFLNDEYDVLFHEISIGHVSFKDLDMNENHLKFVCLVRSFHWGDMPRL